jgi:hypothetical protein
VTPSSFLYVVLSLFLTVIVVRPVAATVLDSNTFYSSHNATSIRNANVTDCSRQNSTCSGLPPLDDSNYDISYLISDLIKKTANATFWIVAIIMAGVLISCVTFGIITAIRLARRTAKEKTKKSKYLSPSSRHGGRLSNFFRDNYDNVQNNVVKIDNIIGTSTDRLDMGKISMVEGVVSNLEQIQNTMRPIAIDYDPDPNPQPGQDTG